jgi:aryl-alcohol dehydrogenase-like predicted oxidoreductase
MTDTDSSAGELSSDGPLLQPERRPLGHAGLLLPPLGFGAFKIGRNEGIKYPTPFDLPTEETVRQLLQQLLALGCTLFDTAPAYGLSEERLGRCLSPRPPGVVISTKVGETFADGRSTFDFSRAGVLHSLERSCQRLQTDVLDVVLIHSPGDDLRVLTETDVVAVLDDWKRRGRIRAIGLSGKTPGGAEQALSWADVLMVEFHLEDRSHQAVMDRAAALGRSVFVKKGLASGRLPAAQAIEFVLSHPAVTSLVLGGLSLPHFTSNWTVACRCRPQASGTANG